MQGHVLGERAPVGETRLGLVRTHLCLTVSAPLAGAAAAHERCGDSVADRPPSYLGAHRGHDADQLVTGNVGKRHPVVVPGPCVPVAATETGGVHLDDHAPWRRRRIGDRSDIHRTTELLEDHRAHEAIMPALTCPLPPAAPRRRDDRPAGPPASSAPRRAPRSGSLCASAPPRSRLAREGSRRTQKRAQRAFLAAVQDWPRAPRHRHR